MTATQSFWVGFATAYALIPLVALVGIGTGKLLKHRDQAAGTTGEHNDADQEAALARKSGDRS